MDKKSKVLFVVFFLVILASVGASFYRYIVMNDYFLKIQIDCDPDKDRCFVYRCSPDEDVECPEDEAERNYYYKIIMKKAYLATECELEDGVCAEMSCEGDLLCKEVLCEEGNVPEGEFCSDGSNSKSL